MENERKDLEFIETICGRFGITSLLPQIDACKTYRPYWESWKTFS